MKSITVFVMLDACRHDYINEDQTPFLHKLRSAGLSARVKPTFGFEPDGAYLAGLYPDQADGGAQFWYDPANSPFKIAGLLPRFADKLPELPQKIIRKLLVKTARPFNKSPNLSTAMLPFSLLDKFALPLAFGLDHPQFSPENQSVFDLLRENNRSWLYHASPQYRVTIDAACRRAEKEMAPPLSFAFFHIGNLDGTGHRFGPGSRQIKEELNLVDKGLQKLFEIAAKRFEEVNSIVMGDHGMVKVERTVDVEKEIRALPLSLGRDYMCIFDSTMARFWFFSEEAKRLIPQKLKKINGGHVIDQEEKDRFHLNYRHNRFGDLIYLADPGSLILPNHYQSSSTVKGMHGYTPDCAGQQAALIIQSKRTKPCSQQEPVDMRQVFPTVCGLLDLAPPAECLLTSLLEE